MEFNVVTSSSPSSPSLLQQFIAPGNSDNGTFQFFWLLARVVAGALMIHNGLDKLGGVEGFAENVVAFIGLPFPVFFTYCAAYVEVVSAALLILGLLTRLNALLLLLTMGVAIFFHLKADGFTIAPLETASLYATLYAFLLASGAGRWSIDALIAEKLSD